MAEQEQSSKTEEPTAKRLTDAFQEGQFAQSAEIQVTFGLASAFLVLLFAGPGVVEQMAAFSVSILGHLGTLDLTEDSIVRGTRDGILMFGRMVLPLLGAAALAAVIAGVLLIKWITPDLNRVHRTTPVYHCYPGWSIDLHPVQRPAATVHNGGPSR